MDSAQILFHDKCHPPFLRWFYLCRFFYLQKIYWNYNLLCEQCSSVCRSKHFFIASIFFCCCLFEIFNSSWRISRNLNSHLSYYCWIFSYSDPRCHVGMCESKNGKFCEIKNDWTKIRMKNERETHRKAVHYGNCIVLKFESSGVLAATFIRWKMPSNFISGHCTYVPVQLRSNEMKNNVA